MTSSAILNLKSGIKRSVALHRAWFLEMLPTPFIRFRQSECSREQGGDMGKSTFPRHAGTILTRRAVRE